MWIGLDIGTTAVKAAAYHSNGSMVAQAEAPPKVIRAEGGISEQNMRLVWETVVAVLSDLAQRIDKTAIRSIGIAAQGDGLWLMNASGIPKEPAVLWNDTRASDDIMKLSESGATATIAHGCHTSLWPGTSGAVWRWLRKNKPETTSDAAFAFTCADWVGFKLTGEIATDFSNASIPFLDFSTRAYSSKQLRALECDELADKLPPPRHASEQLGLLTEKAANEIGFPAGIPISVGTLDLSAMILGMGMDQPGQAMMIIGTTAVVNILTESVTPANEPVGASVLHPTSNAVIRVLAPTTGAAAFDWFVSLHPISLGGDSTNEVAEKLNKLVEDILPGSNGVTFLPYLNGERAPFVAPDITASFVGMRSTTTKADLGRAVMEGTGFSLRHCIDAEGSLPDGSVQLTGGGSKNAVWCQIIADIVGRPIEVSSASDQGLWGAACLGAAAAGFGNAIDLTKREEELRTYVPNALRHKTYSHLFERYKIYSDASNQTRQALRSLGDNS